MIFCEDELQKLKKMEQLSAGYSVGVVCVYK